MIYRKLTGLSINEKPGKISENEEKSIGNSENISSVAIDEFKVESEEDRDDDDDDDDDEKASSENEEEGEGEEVIKKQSRGKRNEDKESKKVRVYWGNFE